MQDIKVNNSSSQNTAKAVSRMYNDNETYNLQIIFYNNFSIERLDEVIKLVRDKGADPNLMTDDGNTLLSELCLLESETIFMFSNAVGTQDKNADSLVEKIRSFIAELVNQHGVDINTKDERGFTVLQNLIDHPSFTTTVAMELVALNADINVRASSGHTLLSRLREENKNGQNDEAIKKVLKINNHPVFRQSFLNLIFSFASILYDSKDSSSPFKALPREIILTIISFLDFDTMGKTLEQGEALAAKIITLEGFREIKEQAKTPGGVNIFEKRDAVSGAIEFKFFKSAKKFCIDYQVKKNQLKETQHHKNPIFDKLTKKELTNSSVNELKKFADQHAVSCWNSHSSLYGKYYKDKLFKAIAKSEPYNNPEIQAKMK